MKAACIDAQGEDFDDEEDEDEDLAQAEVAVRVRTARVEPPGGDGQRHAGDKGPDLVRKPQKGAQFRHPQAPADGGQKDILADLVEPADQPDQNVALKQEGKRQQQRQCHRHQSHLCRRHAGDAEGSHGQQDYDRDPVLQDREDLLVRPVRGLELAVLAIEHGSDPIDDLLAEQPLRPDEEEDERQHVGEPDLDAAAAAGRRDQVGR